MVVSLSPHFVETHKSAMPHSSRCMLRSPLHEFLGVARRLGDRRDVAVALDAEAGHRLAGLGDAVDDALGPAVLDADHDDGRDIGIGAGADQGAEVQLEILAELQPAIGMRDRQRALDVVGDRLAGRVGEVVERQDDDVVAHADAAVLAPAAPEFQVGLAVGRHGAHQRLVLRLWTWTWSPLAMSDDGLADVLAVFDTVSPRLMSVSATLWPIGTSILLSRLEGRIVGGDDAEHVGAGGEALDHHHADRVLLVVHQKMRNAHAPSQRRSSFCGLIGTSGGEVNAGAPARGSAAAGSWLRTAAPEKA